MKYVVKKNRVVILNIVDNGESRTRLHQFLAPKQDSTEPQLTKDMFNFKHCKEGKREFEDYLSDFCTQAVLDMNAYQIAFKALDIQRSWLENRSPVFAHQLVEVAGKTQPSVELEKNLETQAKLEKELQRVDKTIAEIQSEEISFECNPFYHGNSMSSHPPSSHGAVVSLY